MSTDAETLRFIHRFSRSVSCEITLPDTPPLSGAFVMLPCGWIGKPKRRHLPIYRRWILFVSQSLADRWGQKLLYALGVSANQTELWEFEPGLAPRLVEKISVGVPWRMSVENSPPAKGTKAPASKGQAPTSILPPAYTWVGRC